MKKLILFFINNNFGNCIIKILNACLKQTIGIKSHKSGKTKVKTIKKIKIPRPPFLIISSLKKENRSRQVE